MPTKSLAIRTVELFKASIQTLVLLAFLVVKKGKASDILNTNN